MTASGQRQPRRGGIVASGLLVLAAFAFLAGLGIWQIERKAWKENLIATLTERLAAAPTALPPSPAWATLDPDTNEYRHVTFSAELLNDREALVYTSGSAFRRDISGPGYWVFTPARVADGGTVVINRGFVPEGRQNPETRVEGQVTGPIEITGVLRWPETAGAFTPKDEPQKNLWFTRDHLAMAAAKGWGKVAPFFVEQESPTPPGGLPEPGPLMIHLRNEHLQYALTWFGLAAALLVVFALRLRRRGKRPA